MNRPCRLSAALAGLLVACAVLPVRAGWWPFDGGKARIFAQVDPAPADHSGTQVVTSFAPVVKKVGPSVVTVFTTKKVREQAQGMVQTPFGPIPFDDPRLQRFFGTPNGTPNAPQQGQGQNQNQGRTRNVQGLGSGVILSPDGYIVTNVHVVEGADEIKVSLANEKKEYDAKLIGKDPLSDIALLKIDAKDLPAITLADSGQVEVGDVVLVIGNPFNLGQTVTMGIVSALGRNIPENQASVGDLNDFIQTDAAINQGNSGGALVDSLGRLIGVSSMLVSRNGGNVGIGFAIPSNTVRSVADSLLKQGRVVRGFLGVRLDELSPELAQKFGVADGQGVVISSVEPDTAAADAGVKVGDVITQFNGRKIDGSHALRVAVTDVAPGQKVQMVVVRDGKEKTLFVVLREMKAAVAEGQAGQAPGAPADEAAPAVQAIAPGVQIGDFNDDARRQFSGISYPADLRGAAVLSVDPDSPVAGRLQPGDVILSVEHKDVRSAKEAVAAAKTVDGAKEGLLLLVWQRGVSSFLVIKTD